MPTPTSTESEWSSGQKLAAFFTIVLGVVAVLVAFYLWQTAEQRAVEQLPEAERRALFERTLRTLEDACDPQKKRSGLDQYCRQQADFLAMFPECDTPCRALLERHRDSPTR